MNKTELINAIAKDSGLSKVSSKKALNAFLTTVSKALKKGEKITLIGHGTYQVVERSARTGINPQTKKSIKIPARKAVRFKPGKNLI